MDPMFLELPTDLDGPNSSFSSSTLLQPDGVPQESKLATYLRNREVLSKAVPNLDGMNDSNLLSKESLGSYDCDAGVPTKDMRGGIADEWKAISRVPDTTSPMTTSFLPSFATLPALGEPSTSLATTTAEESLVPFADRTNSNKFQNDSVMDVPTFLENVGGTTYFYKAKDIKYTGTNNSGTALNNRDSNCSIYSKYPMAGGLPSRPTLADSGLREDDLRLEMLDRQSITHSHIDQTEFKNIPQEVDLYYELVPLEHISSASKPMMNYATSVYKATHMTTGNHHCLYRVHNYTVSSLKITQIFDAWKSLKHSSLVQLYEVFTTKAFGDKSIIFVYEYYPGAETLDEKLFDNGYSKGEWECLSNAATTTEAAANTNRMLAESTLWNYIIQLTGVIRLVHSLNLSCRTLTPSKILLTDNRSRIRLNCSAIISVLSFDPNNPNLTNTIQSYQQEDLTNLGKLMVALACRSYVSIQRDNLAVAMELINRTYSRDLSMLCVCLLTSQRVKNINDIMPMIGARFYGALDTAMVRGDNLEAELNKELENGRLFRLITKLNTIIDRAHLKLDPSWSETGDRYMLKLFQDYVFHQHTEDGQPWLDMGHIISTLNKLDCGSPDKICLMSHNQQNVLVVSYKEVKHAFERSFQELLQTGSIPKATTKPNS